MGVRMAYGVRLAKLLTPAVGNVPNAARQKMAIGAGH